MFIITFDIYRTSEKPVEVRPMQPPNTNVVVGQKKKRFEAPKSVRFEAQISEVSGKSTGPVKGEI